MSTSHGLVMIVKEFDPILLDVVHDRLIQADEAPARIKQVEFLVEEFNGRYSYYDKAIHKTVTLDRQDLQIMKGTLFGVLTELRGEGITPEVQIFPRQP